MVIRLADDKKPPARRGDSERQTGLVLDERTRTKKPPLYKVLLHNDDYTTWSSWCAVLQTVFHKDEVAAVAIMRHVHNNGLGRRRDVHLRGGRDQGHQGGRARKSAAVSAAAADRAHGRIRLSVVPRTSSTPRLRKNMPSPELQSIIQLAVDDVRGRRRHEYLTLEHLLLALTEEPRAPKLLAQCGADLERLRERARGVPRGHVEQLPEGVEADPEQTIGVQRVLQRAAMHVASSGRQR